MKQECEQEQIKTVVIKGLKIFAGELFQRTLQCPSPKGVFLFKILIRKFSDFGF